MRKILLTALVVLTGVFLLSAAFVWAGFEIGWIELPKTGQTISYRTGDDGDLQTGTTIPCPRFIDNGDGTATDNLTGLMWAKDANMAETIMNWHAAIDYANNLSLGNKGCGTNYTDWRLPNVKELESLIDFSNYSTTLPNGNPFSYVQFDRYWSSTTYTGYTSSAWTVGMYWPCTWKAAERLTTTMYGQCAQAINYLIIRAI